MTPDTIAEQAEGARREAQGFTLSKLEDTAAVLRSEIARRSERIAGYFDDIHREEVAQTASRKALRDIIAAIDVLRHAQAAKINPGAASVM